jgi:hypothetical protein
MSFGGTSRHLQDLQQILGPQKGSTMASHLLYDKIYRDFEATKTTASGRVSGRRFPRQPALAAIPAHHVPDTYRAIFSFPCFRDTALHSAKVLAILSRASTAFIFTPPDEIRQTTRIHVLSDTQKLSL